MKAALQMKGNVARSVNPYGIRQEVLNEIIMLKLKGLMKALRRF